MFSAIVIRYTIMCTVIHNLPSIFTHIFCLSLTNLKMIIILFHKKWHISVCKGADKKYKDPPFPEMSNFTQCYSFSNFSL